MLTLEFVATVGPIQYSEWRGVACALAREECPAPLYGRIELDHGIKEMIPRHSSTDNIIAHYRITAKLGEG